MGTRTTKRMWWGVALASKVLVASVFACSGGAPATPTMATADGGKPTASTTPTYYADVKPLMDEKCAICHYAGGIAPFTLLSYDDANTHLAEIGSAVGSKTMPPWPPSDTCNQYLGDRSLSAAQISMITSWVSAGGPQGDPASYKPLGDPPPPSLSRVDDELQMPEAYTPQERPDDYRCFLIPWPETAEKFISGFGAKPGQPTIVHHLLVYQIPAAQIPTYQAYDDADPGPGYTCFGGPTGSLNANGTSTSTPDDAGASLASIPQQVGGWVPGSTGSDFAAGTGIRIDPGSMIVLQVHYNTLSAPPVPDQTKLDFELTDSVTKEAFIIPFTNPAWPQQHTMDIPAGDPSVTHEYKLGAGLLASYLTNGAVGGSQPFTLYSSLLHMHLHGTQTTVGLDHSDGTSTCLLDIEHWNFHWQGTYQLAKPVTVSPDDQLDISCQWDNSAANQPIIDGQPMPLTDLNWGEGTTDEMCISFLYVTQ